eukprot:m.223283 g.223283  ORF g.223283 m.223283 type:complete len:98 (-) comp18751_c0_seq2:1971-2264(-)
MHACSDCTTHFLWVNQERAFKLASPAVRSLLLSAARLEEESSVFAEENNPQAACDCLARAVSALTDAQRQAVNERVCLFVGHKLPYLRRRLQALDRP